MKSLANNLVRESVFYPSALPKASKDKLEVRFYDDAASEYDAVFLYKKINSMLSEQMEPFRDYFLHWLDDELDHYNGFAELYSVLVSENGEVESARQALDEEMAIRRPDYTRIEPFLADEFTISLLFAYDELMNTLAYKAEFDLYDSFGSKVISTWIRGVARDEARHHAGALFLLRVHHRHRKAEAEKILSDIIAVDLSGDPYTATFVLDRGDDKLNEARSEAEKCGERVLRQLHRYWL